VIRDDKDGLLVRCGDVNGLAAALRRLSYDAELRRRLGAAGLERTRHEFEWADKFEIVCRVYREMASPSNTARTVPSVRLTDD
jgi:glycosyltransferase involved in cell wall biosynthesis